MMFGRVGGLMSRAPVGALNQLFLLPVGPFQILTPPLVTSLGDSVDTTVNPLSGTSRLFPFKCKNINITDGGGIFADLTNINGQGAFGSIYAWCDVFTMTGSATLTANGEDGEAAQFDGTAYYGGNGGGGASGGAGGSASVSGSFVDGAPGGSNGASGISGNSDGDPNSVPGGGGIGCGPINDGYSYGNGGNGNGVFGGGLAGNGVGGGGDSAPVDLGPGASGGPGGSGGLIAVVSRVFQSTIFGSMPSITANGGSGGPGIDGGEPGGDGGGGVVDWYCMKKAGSFSVAVFGANSGSIRFWEIKKNGALILHTNPADVWDNT